MWLKQSRLRTVLGNCNSGIWLSGMPYLQIPPPWQEAHVWHTEHTVHSTHKYTALTYLSRCESCVVQHGWCGASGVGVGVHESASLLSHVWGALGGGGPTVDGSGWGRGAGRSWEPDVLIPGPVVRRGLPVGLLGKLVHLGQRNKWIDKCRVFVAVVWI